MASGLALSLLTAPPGRPQACPLVPTSVLTAPRRPFGPSASVHRGRD